MTTPSTLAEVVDDSATLVVLTVYARRNVAVCGRVVQALAVSRVTSERIVADFSPPDLSRVNGLEHEKSPTMTIVLVVSIPTPQDLERLTKVLNRIVDIFKIVHSHRF